MYAKFLDHNIYYTDSGKGSTVVILLHGYLESSGTWDSFAEKLSGNYRVITVDLPGHGLSDTYGEVHSMEFMAEAVKAVVVNLGLDKVIIVSHSLGGYVALAFLELFPGMLAGYCLFHSHPLADSPEALEKREREIGLVQAGKKDLMYPGNVEKMFASKNLEKLRDVVERSKDIASGEPAEGIIAVLRGMMTRPSRLNLMEKGVAPCLWILGALDNYIDCNLIQKKVNLPANARLEILKDSGHMGFVEEEELSLKLIKTFLELNGL